MSNPPAPLRVRLPEQDMAEQPPSDSRIAAPVATATAPAIASRIGPTRRGGAGGAGGGGGGAGGVSSSMCARRASATFSIVPRASSTVQTSQLFDSVAIGNAAGAAPSVENNRTTLL